MKQPPQELFDTDGASRLAVVLRSLAFFFFKTGTPLSPAV